MIGIDLETYSDAHLPTVGSYRYAADPSTEVLVLAYGRPGEAVQTWCAGDPLPEDLCAALRAGEDLLAHNASFDREVFEHVLVARNGWPAVTGRWLDSRALCALLGLPRSLEQAAAALELEERKQEGGKKLIQLFSIPHRGVFSRVRPEDAPVEWAHFVDYCAQDVRTLLDLVERLARYLPRLEDDHPAWEADFQMNRRGIRADLELTEALIQLAEPVQAAIAEECVRLTGGIGPGQVQALSNWLKGRMIDLSTLGETEITERLSGELPEDVRRVLELRLEGSRSAWRKAYAIRESAAADGRLHNQLAYGSTHTFRWAGRGVQLQNLPRPKLKPYEIAAAIEILVAEPEAFVLFFPKPMEALSSLTRALLTATEGARLGICDYAKIEVVVLAWLARDAACLRALETGGDLYRELAAKIFGVPEAEVSAEQRFLGKGGILGGGYGASWKAFQESGRKQGVKIPTALAKATVGAYREKHAAVVTFWNELELAAIRAVALKEPQTVGPHLTFYAEDLWLFCRLPSGRCLSWFRPVLKRRSRYGNARTELWFSIVGKNGKPIPVSTFGGKLCENVVSSTARDLLAESLVAAEAEGLRPVLTVHDELVCEGPPGVGKALAEIMLRRPAWAPNLPIGVEYQEAVRYGK